MRPNLLLPMLMLFSAILPTGRVAEAEMITLYDAAVGNLPNQQGWLNYVSLFGTASQTPVVGGVRLQSNLQASSGYGNHQVFSTPVRPLFVNGGFPLLDHNLGFSLDFQLEITSENHLNQNRAGFSVIAIGDNNRGVELGFWQDRIFAQNDDPIFTAGEAFAFDTTSAMHSYSLSLIGDEYSLSANGTEILTGDLRDYSAFGGVPYTLSNFLFLGDNTTSAEIDVTLGTIRLNSNLSAVPEPDVYWTMLVASVGLLIRKSGRRKGREAVIQ